MKAIAPGFGGINLEDIAAPRCFEIEQRLQAELDIPVFHDDQHGTAVVVLAALINALKLVEKQAADVRVVMVGVGAAGIAVADMLAAHGVTDLIGCDRKGALYAGREGLDAVRREFAERTNPRRFAGTIAEALPGADVVDRAVGAGHHRARRGADDGRSRRSSSRLPTRRPRCSRRTCATTSR